MADTKPHYEGKERYYIVADDVHAYIKAHGGGKFLTTYFRAIIAHESVQK